MTKNSNAMTLRLGYNLFWLYKKSSIFVFFNLNSIFDFFQKEFKKQFYLCFKLKLYYTQIIINIYSLNIKNQRLNVKLNNVVHNTIIKFSNKNNFVTKKIIFIKKKWSNNFNISGYFNCQYLWMNISFIMEIFLNKIILYSFMLYISINNKYIIIISIFHYCSKLAFIRNIKLSSNFKILKNIDNFLVRFTKKKVLFQLLRFKLLELYFENLLLRYYYRFYEIHINNILNTSITDYFFTKYNQNLILKSKKRKIYFIMYLIISLQNIELLARYVGSLLYKTYQHRKIIKTITTAIIFIHIKRLINFKGFKIYMAGKLNGKMKKSKYSFKLGEVWLNTLNSKISYYYLPLYTKFGILSLKLWLFI